MEPQTEQEMEKLLSEDSPEGRKYRKDMIKLIKSKATVTEVAEAGQE